VRTIAYALALALGVAFATSYENVQFTKAPNVLRGMGLTHLSKNEQAFEELTRKGWRQTRKS
jgi:hypothetical protein